MLNELYRVAFRKKIYRALEELQADLDAWMQEYNERRPHQGAAGAMGRRLCTRSSIVCRSRRRKYWPPNLGGTRCLSDEVLSYTA